MENNHDSILSSFHQKLKSEYLLNTSNYEEEITKLYYQLLKILSANYETYRENIPRVLGSLEENSSKAFSYSASIFFNLFNELIAKPIDRKFDIADYDVSENITKKFYQSLREMFESSTQFRIAEMAFKIDDYSKDEKKELISLLVSFVLNTCRSDDFDSDKSENILLQLGILRILAKDAWNVDLFYFTSGVFIEKLNLTQNLQTARDFSEEILIASFQDDVPELGFLNSFKCYSMQRSVHTALFYANLSSYFILSKKKPLLDKYIQDFISISMKYFRNIDLYQFAIDTYHKIPATIQFNERDRKSLDHIYFTSLLKASDPLLPVTLLDYFNRERESLLKSNPYDFRPWLINLYHIKRLYPKADFSNTGLGYYLKIFEAVIPKEFIEYYTSIIFGRSSELKSKLEHALLKLTETRNLADIVYDNEHALTIANRMVKDAFNQKDEEAILLSMIVKSDFSLLFKPKNVEELVRFQTDSTDNLNFQEIYGNSKELLNSHFRENPKILFLWLVVAEGEAYCLQRYEDIYTFQVLQKWDWKYYKNLLIADFFSSLNFDDTIKTKWEVRQVLKEEFVLQSQEIQSKIEFCKIDINTGNRIFLVKDMELANFPHNLLLNANSEFIHNSTPITNVLSTEWILSSKPVTLEKSFSKSIWIPTSEGDFVISKLFGGLEDFLIETAFDIQQELNIDKPISSDINIVCSHGASDIASKQVIYPAEQPIANFGKIIGKGKILIFFVCHSGSYQTDFFRNDISSIVKTNIKLGYEAVIAPFWALHVDIPKIWLPVFLSALEAGDMVDIALYKANKEVFEKYPTPSAWANMHLYGNPNISIKD